MFVIVAKTDTGIFINIFSQLLSTTPKSFEFYLNENINPDERKQV